MCMCTCYNKGTEGTILGENSVEDKTTMGGRDTERDREEESVYSTKVHKKVGDHQKLRPTYSLMGISKLFYIRRSGMRTSKIK